MVFDIQAFNKDSSAVVIDATDLYISDMTELGLDLPDPRAVQDPQGRSQAVVHRKRPLIPGNIETRVTVTYDAGQVPLDNALSTISMLLHHSMVRLPEKPMMPRLYDERVSFFSNQVYDYGYDGHRAERRRHISRWRLEPKDTAAFLRENSSSRSSRLCSTSTAASQTNGGRI